MLCHCRPRCEAEALQASLEARFESCGLALHPTKTRVIYSRTPIGTTAILIGDFVRVGLFAERAKYGSVAKVRSQKVFPARAGERIRAEPLDRASSASLRRRFRIAHAAPPEMYRLC